MDYTSKIGTRLADLNNSAYSSFQPNGIKGQCVWYVRGRAWEKCKADTKITGNANTWFERAKAKGLRTGCTLQSDSICCINRGKFGHVIYIEYVDGNTVYYTEANANGDNKVSSDDGILKKCAVSKMHGRDGYAGCIYLTDNESEEFEMAKKFQNGSTRETVYSCSDFTGKIGSLDPKEECQCLGVFSGAYAVLYNHSEHSKIGFVKYSGGVK